MKHNSITQSDTTLKFDGAERESTGRVNQKMHTNAWSGHMNDGREVNMGRGPTKGNMGCGKPGKPGAMTSVTKDSFRAAPTDALPGSMKIKNPDYINGGAQVRTPGGTRTWDPKAGQNYAGNPDKIRIDQSGGGSFNRETAGRRPATRGGETNFNFGPKSQY
jgi:hypothetical protein